MSAHAHDPAFFDQATTGTAPDPVPSHTDAAGGAALVGSPTPRICTKPILDLEDPRNSDGYAFIEWAQTQYGLELLPWQRFLAVALLEKHATLPDRWRYRQALIVCSRQVGKSEVLGALAVFMVATGRARLVVSASQKIAVSFRLVQRIHARLMQRPELGLLPAPRGRSARTMRPGLHSGSADPHLEFADGSMWVLASTKSDDSGRGDAADLLILDEAATLKGEEGNKVWGALEATTSASRFGMSVAISTPGDSESTAFNARSDVGRANAANPDYRGTSFYAEWSGEDGCDVGDRQQWARACPALNHTITEELYRDLAADTDASVFRVERLAQRVASLVPTPFTSEQWDALADSQLSLDPVQDRLFLGIDAGPDLSSVIAVAVGVTDDGRALMAPVGAWKGRDASNDFRAEFPALLDRLLPQAWGYSSSKGAIRGLKTFLEAVTPAGQAMPETDVITASMQLADEVVSRHLRHRGDAVLDECVTSTKKHRKPDGSFVIVARGDADVSGYYAASIALRLARTTKHPRLQLFV